MPSSRVSRLVRTTHQYLHNLHKVEWNARSQERAFQMANAKASERLRENGKLRDLVKNNVTFRTLSGKPIPVDEVESSTDNSVCLIEIDPNLNHELAQIIPKKPKAKPTPYELANTAFEGLEFYKEDLQGFVLNVGEFQRDVNFDHVGIPISVMIDMLMPKYKILELDLNNQAPVEVPDDFKVQDGAPSGLIDPFTSVQTRAKEYYRTQLLLSYLGYRHSTGRLILNGNLGGQFADYALGGEIVLEGSTGEFPCTNLNGATVRIKGFAGHKLLAGGQFGIVYVIGSMCCLGKDMPTGYLPDLRCYLNGNPIIVADHMEL